mmetsp:Transcript_20663/g.31529  ORF Transcript_20663/g.31529 Transcript_20663/m.31529 type:complete len:80 (+) Transcript_20663:1773-2012(+)
MRSSCHSQNRLQPATDYHDSLLPSVKTITIQEKPEGFFRNNRNKSAKGPRPPMGDKFVKRTGKNDSNFRHLLSNRQLSR